ncbi:MAG: hypothetical protein Q8O72_13705 [Bacteroidales bacterium]|nr:hypothetical protein [Bacteroidales bacterium]
MMQITLRYVLLFIGFTVSFSALSQQRFGGGITAGVVGSQVAGDSLSGYHKGGIFGGGFVTIGLGGMSSAQMELTYFQKGSRENPIEENNYRFFLLRLNYVEMAILYQHQMGSFMFEGGPSVGVLTSFYEENTYEIVSNVSGYPKPARFTLQINLGMVLLVSDQWQAFLRTNNSMMSVRGKDYKGVFRFWDYGQYNDALVLGLRYVFRAPNR